MKELQIEITNDLHDNLCVKLNKDISNVFNLNHELHLEHELNWEIREELNNIFLNELNDNETELRRAINDEITRTTKLSSTL